MGLNNVVLEGRLTRDPDVRAMENGTSVARFSLAVDRDVPSSDGTRKADFINCVAFGKTAEFVDKWLTKGKGIAIVGHIQTGSYKNKDGATVYTTDVIVDRAIFPLGGKQEKKEAQGETEEQMGIPEGFEQISDDDIPF